MAQKVCPYRCKSGRVFNTVLREWQPCPECTGVLTELSSAEVTDTVNSKIDALGIPHIYRDYVFSPDNFFSDSGNSVFSEATFKPILEVLTSLELAIKAVGRPDRSYYFFCGMFAKTTEYAFYLLKQAVLHGLTAVPYASLSDLAGLRSGTPSRIGSSSLVTYADYVSADVCILQITAASTNQDANLLADLLAERSRRGLPTLCFGYWSQVALKQSRSSLHYVIRESGNYLSHLKPLEVMSRAKYAEERKNITNMGGKNVLGTVTGTDYKIPRP